MKIPYITNDMLFPTNIEAINSEGLSVHFFKNLELKPVCFFCISKNSLFEETKAISRPEKKAERKRDDIIIISIVSIIYFENIYF